MHTYVCAVGTRRGPRLRYNRSMNAVLTTRPPPQTRAVASIIALVLAAAAMAAGVWFGYFAWSLDSFPHGAAAVVLLLTAPALAMAAILARYPTDVVNEGTSALDLSER